jgi:AcrR family transcriptional regulator
VSLTRAVGIAQPSFYAHFRDVADLLHTVVGELSEQRRSQTRRARRRLRAAPRDDDRLRDTFRVPLEDMTSHPRLFRLVQRARNDPASPIGQWARGDLDDSRAALVSDLVAAGARAGTEQERQRIRMCADVVIAMTETIAEGLLDGRYRSMDDALDVLTAFSAGYLPLLFERVQTRPPAHR